ncbi:MAG TPA: tetratricopeptide repeat protein [bacterium]|nr:tetratricopeptide repeat protein [bacterium]
MKRIFAGRIKMSWVAAAAAMFLPLFALGVARAETKTPADMFNDSMSLISGGRRAEAAAMLARIADEHPADQLACEALIQLGRLYENMGRPAEAEAAYLRAATENQSHPRAPEALAFAADIIRKSGRSADAAALYEACLDLYPDSGVADRVKFDIAFLYEGLGRREEAAAVLRSLVAKTGTQSAERAGRELIQMYTRAGLLYEAETAAAAFLSVRPGDVSVRLQLFNILLDRAKYDQAIPVIESLTKEQPDNRGLRELLFKAYKDAGRMKELVAALEQNKKNAPGDLEQARRLKDLYVWDGKTIEAMLELETILKTEPGSVADAVELSKMYYKEQWVTKARETLERALEIKPGYEPALRELGALWFAEGEMEKALEAWRAAASFNPSDVQSYYRMTGYLRQHRLYDMIIDLYTRGREALGQPSLFARDMAWILQMQMRNREAIDEYLKVIAETPGDSGAREAVFKLLEAEGPEGEGVGMIERAADARPDIAELWLMSAEALILRGNEAGAEQRMEKISQARPDARSEVAGRLMSRSAPALAARLFESAAEIEPGDPSVKLMQAGRAWLASGEAVRAENCFRKVADGFHNAPQADEALALIARISNERGDVLSARGYYARLASEHPGSPYRSLAEVEEAVAAFKLGEYEHAGVALERLSSDPRAQRFADRILFYRAEIERFSLRFEAAVELYLNLARRYPESRSVGEAISRALFLKDAETADPIHVQAITAAERKSLAGDAEGAEAMLRGLLVALPEGAMKDHSALMLASLLEKEGRLEQAVAAYLILADAPEPKELKPQACARLASLLASMNRQKEALVYFQKTIEADPRGYWGQLARQGAGSLQDIF